ncbi:MAG: tetratricopeptide repeat protein [Bacteroidia bacterium]|nr:tetratricopeptide repeat protein [Bacteroidia bacterium]
MGLLHTLIGSIPDKYKWGVDLIGMEGDLDQGINELTELMKNPPTEYKHIDSEVKILLSFILKYYRMFDHDSRQYLNATKHDSSSLLWVFCKADELMVKRENETVIKLLENRPTDDGYLPFYFLDYLTGISKLKRLDSDANEPLEYFIEHFNGLNYIKSAYQKLAWHYLINDDPEKYHYYINFCKDNGDTFIDDDVQALKELESGVVPHKDILKARLLFDGGYFEKADKILNEIPEQSLTTEKNKVELIYRKARLLHEWGKPDEAIPYYDQTLVNAIELKFYFAANSALQLGYIYEKRQDYKKAKVHYEKCIDIHDHGYKSYLEFKSKLALNKLENDHPELFN